MEELIACLPDQDSLNQMAEIGLNVCHKKVATIKRTAHGEPHEGRFENISPMKCNAIPGRIMQGGGAFHTRAHPRGIQTHDIGSAALDSSWLRSIVTATLGAPLEEQISVHFSMFSLLSRSYVYSTVVGVWNSGKGASRPVAP